VGDKWWAKIREGLFRDPSGKHYKRIGEAIWAYVYLHMCVDINSNGLVPPRTYGTISRDTGISKRTVRRMIKKLEQFGYIKMTRLSHSFAITITNYNPIETKKELSRSGQSKDGVSGHLCQSERPPVTQVSKSEQSLNVSKCGAKVLSLAESGHSNKTHIQDPNIYTVFDFWNDQEIITHREPKKFKSCINARLQNYSVEELCQAIKNYGDILKSKDHFFTYHWTLEEFLSRKNALDKFLDRETAFENFRGNGSPKTPFEPPKEETEEERLLREERVRRASSKFDRECGIA